MAGLVAAKHRSVDTSRTAMVPRSHVPRSSWDIQTGHKTTFDAGYLIPMLVLEVLPADTWRVQASIFARLAQPIVPVMDNLTLETFWFFVPNRLTWSNWERFMGEQADPSDVTQFLIPQVPMASTDSVVGSVPDYFGVRHEGGGATYNVNALPFRAYALIWNDWFRDQDIDTPIAVPVTDGPDVMATYINPLRRRKRHDYFTSCRPWPQKPDAAPALGTWLEGVFSPGHGYSYGAGTPQQVGAPVAGIGVANANVPVAGGAIAIKESGSRGGAVGYYANQFNDTAHEIYLQAQNAGNFPAVRVLINDIRQANVIQVLQERNARGGTRYAEQVWTHFGVRSPDQRLQRPEYLGGGRSPVHVNPVAQTSASGVAGTTTVLGELAGIGTVLAVGRQHGFSASFTEHGYVIGLLSIRADINYQQGTHRMWYRRGRYDFYLPALANLPEQAVMKRELYADGSATDLQVFGYNERWSEYKEIPSRISGAFRSTQPTPLHFWHFAQDFTAHPQLNAAFLEESFPIDRVLQVDAPYGHEFLCDQFFDCRVARAMPLYSVPGLGGTL